VKSIARSLVQMATAGALVAVGIPLLQATATAAPVHNRVPVETVLGLSSSTPVQKSTGFAGYSTEAAKLKSIVATFEVPSIKRCGKTADSGFGPLVIVGSSTLFVGAGAEAACEDGTTTYQIAVNYNGSESKLLTVKPKDKITVRITMTSKNTIVKINDLNSKRKLNKREPASHPTFASLGDDSLVNEDTGQQVPIPPFTNHRFFNCEVNGKALSKATPLIDQELVNGKTVLIKAGPLTSKGTAFTMYFKKAS